MEICKICHGGCCRKEPPLLWGSDIIRICEALNFDLNFFTTVYPIAEDKIEETSKHTPLFIFTNSGEKQHFSLVLKFNESKFYPGTSKCIFLQEWSAEALGSEELTGIVGRCGIYSCRPVSCRAYPAKYDEEKKEIIIKDPYLALEKEHKMTTDSSACKLCPQALTEADYKPFMESYAANSVLNKYEKDFFMNLAEKWNKNPDVSDNFYDFLVKEYNDRIEYTK